MRKLISSGSTFEKDIGYSRAVVDGDWCFVSGTTGYDYDKMSISDDVVEQCDQCFRNIEKAMKQGGFELADVVRVHYLVPVASDFEKCYPVTRKYFGEIRPAATMFEAKLANAQMKIEIEVTAKKRS